MDTMRLTLLNVHQEISQFPNLALKIHFLTLLSKTPVPQFMNIEWKPSAPDACPVLQALSLSSIECHGIFSDEAEV
jgi:hypothetical protein